MTLRPSPTRRSPISRTVIVVNIALHLPLCVGLAVSWAGHYFSAAFTLGLIVTAYTLGLRHAFDPDHIAAIDNTTRALSAKNIPSSPQSARQRFPQTIGMFFALGHSSVVILAAGLIAASVKFIGINEDSSFSQALGIWGAAFSGIVLVTLAIVNFITLISLFKQLKKKKATHGELAFSEKPGAIEYSQQSPSALDDGAPRGFLTQIIGPVLRKVAKPWHMYPVGFLFGLGFDTATEISLLILATGSAAAGTPWWTIMLLPLAFTAGMTMMDSADGVLMAHAYGLSSLNPAFKLRYNITMTSISVIFAAIIGLTGLSTLAAELGIHQLSWVEAIPLDDSGYVIAAFFLIAVVLMAISARKLSGTTPSAPPPASNS